MKPSPMKPSQLLAKRKNWNQGCYARDRLGVRRDWRAKAAVKWCLLGAVFKCFPGRANAHKAADALARIRQFLPSRFRQLTIPQFNDHPKTTHALIVAVLKKAGL